MKDLELDSILVKHNEAGGDVTITGGDNMYQLFALFEYVFNLQTVSRVRRSIFSDDIKGGEILCVITVLNSKPHRKRSRTVPPR